MAKHWIEQRLAEIGQSKSALARHLGLAPARITEITNGTRRIQAGELPQLAMFLQLPVDVLLSHLTDSLYRPQRQLPAGVREVQVRGEVCAGVWSEAAEWEPEEFETLFVPQNGYPGLYALKVSGNSMNLRYPEGTTLLVAPLMEFDRPVAAGTCVIAQAVKGGLYETTVKELQLSDGRYWLWPRSSDPKHQAPIEIAPPEQWPDARDDDISIIGVVVGSYRNELPA